MLIIIFIVFAILSFAVNARLKSKFKKYSKVSLKSGLSGRAIAERMLHDNGIYDVKILNTPGKLSDHYNPVDKTVNLSDSVYSGISAASAAVAAHECGHAVQHAKAYGMLKLRTALVPLQNVSAKIMNFLFLAMIFGGYMLYDTFPYQLVLMLIISIYAVFTLFAFVTLPVEFDASKRALNWIDAQGIVTSQEHEAAKDALKWAAMTYVVTALGTFVTLLYYVSMFLGSRD